MGDALDEIHQFAFGSATFNQLEEKIDASPVAWAASDGVLFCSAFEISRLIYFMFTKIIEVPDFDQSLVKSVIQIAGDEFILDVLTSMRLLCEHRRQRLPEGVVISEAEFRMRAWIHNVANWNHVE